MIKLHKGDCFEVMNNIPDGSVDLVLCDPPYGTMNGAPLSAWLKRDDTCKWDKKLDTYRIFAELSRILRQNGKAILFAQEPYTSELITESIASLPFSYRAIWLKTVAGNSLMSKKAMVNLCEDIVIFQKNGHDYAGNNPNREYFKRVLNYVGGKKLLISELGGKVDHTTRVNSTQFALCTEETYNEMIEKFELEKMPGFIGFKTLDENELKYKNKYPSVFNLWQGKKSKSNVLEYAKDNDGYHPTQKPILLLEDLIKTYSNEGDTVLDFTMGSGSTGVACVNTGRSFIGIERDDKYYSIAEERIYGAVKAV